MSNHPHMRPNGNQPQQIPITVNPAPVPVQVVVEQASGPQGTVVVLRFFSPTGQTVFFLSPDDAKSIANMIQQRATSVILN